MHHNHQHWGPRRKIVLRPKIWPTFCGILVETKDANLGRNSWTNSSVSHHKGFSESGGGGGGSGGGRGGGSSESEGGRGGSGES